MGGSAFLAENIILYNFDFGVKHLVFFFQKGNYKEDSTPFVKYIFVVIQTLSDICDFKNFIIYVVFI